MSSKNVGGRPTVGLLDRGSPEWNIVSAYLSLCSRSSRVRLKAMWTVMLPGISHEANRRLNEKLLLPCFIPCSSLGKSNPLEEVLRRGLDMDDSGFLVPFGTLTFPNIPIFVFNANSEDIGGSKQLSGTNLQAASSFKASTHAQDRDLAGWLERQSVQDQPATYDFLLCDVGVGVSYPVNSWAEAAHCKRFSLPKGYDSLILPVSGSATDAEQTTTLGLPSGRSVGVSMGNRDNIEGYGRGGFTGGLIATVFEGEDDMRIGSLMEDFSKGLPSGPSQEQFKKNYVGILPQSRFKCYFKVFDSCQVLPKFLVTIEAAPSAYEDFCIPLCCQCQESPAVIYCVADHSRLCSLCDESLHASNKIVARHVRVKLNEMPQPVEKCHIHPYSHSSYYCLICDHPVCPLCVYRHGHGSNSVTTSAPHFVPLMDAYSSAMADLENAASTSEAERVSEPFSGRARETLLRRKRVLHGRLREIATLRKQINSSTSKAEEKAFQILSAALTQLIQQTDSQMSQLLESQMARYRHINTIAQGDGFLNYLRSILPPADFLRQWLNHCQLMKLILRLQEKSDRDGRNAPLSAPLMRLTGQLRITS